MTNVLDRCPAAAADPMLIHERRQLIGVRLIDVLGAPEQHIGSVAEQPVRRGPVGLAGLDDDMFKTVAGQPFSAQRFGRWWTRPDPGGPSTTSTVRTAAGSTAACGRTPVSRSQIHCAAVELLEIGEVQDEVGAGPVEDPTRDDLHRRAVGLQAAACSTTPSRDCSAVPTT